LPQVAPLQGAKEFVQSDQEEVHSRCQIDFVSFSIQIASEHLFFESFISVTINLASSSRFFKSSRKKWEALHMESMVLHGLCALHQMVLLYDFVYAVKIVLKKPHFRQKLIKSIHFGSAAQWGK
jgi:hypothetical protein